jgi:dipeptidyl aminopeptidase/acylaminoacyl peptidase
MKRPLLAAVLLFLAATAPAAEKRRIELSDVTRLVGLSDPQIAPDGRSVAVVVSRANVEKNRFDTEIDIVDVATGSVRVLTRERKGVSHPRFSPGGDRLAFLAASGKEKEERLQIHVLPMNGGDADRITDAPDGVQHFTWKPDGTAIAYAAPDEPKDRKAAEKGEDAFEVGNDAVFVSEAARPVHIWLVPAKGGDAKRLTSGAWSLPVSLPPSPPASPLAFSPDGKRIAYAEQATPHSGDSDRAAVRVLEVETGAVRPLTGKALFEGFPSFSPDGSRIAYWCSRDRDPFNVNDVYVVPEAGGSEGTNLTRKIDRCFYRSIWMPDGRSLLVGANDGTRVSLWTVPLQGEARRLDLGRANPSWSFWVQVNVGKDGAIAFTGSEPDHPTELYYMASAAARPRRLTDFNAQIAALDLARVEPFEWDGPDGYREDGVLILPPGAAPGAKLPLVLHIHGGPQAASTQSFNTLAQIMAAKGWLVFQPNYRGSDNRGNAYQHAIFDDAGDGPGRDVLSGIAALKRRGLVDQSRIAVSGWSYGGYMTSWLIGHDDSWKAAVAGAAVTDLEDEYHLGDFNVQWRYGFAGAKPPWSPDVAKAWRDQSPITYAGRIKTPTLILTDTGDARVPPTQSFKLYHVLRENGVPVQFVAYPVPGHFPGDPLRTRDVFRRWIEWLEKYLSVPEAAR